MRVGTEPSVLSAVHMAEFAMRSKARSRVLPALEFMRKRLHFAPDISFARTFRPAKSGALGHGAKQAPGGGPPEQECQVSGCVRFVHAQCTRLTRLDERTMLFDCLRGKQRHLRAGFLWSCPRFSLTGVDFGGMLSRQSLKVCHAWASGLLQVRS